MKQVRDNVRRLGRCYSTHVVWIFTLLPQAWSSLPDWFRVPIETAHWSVPYIEGGLWLGGFAVAFYKARVTSQGGVFDRKG